eukprot:CAMPEP_0194549120 /NCGR_PEP_ID=MMETSP0253-20130528/94729_1 /TAXON_ID=2966 /ORGANISM="Noctiluca scintillans" /LENGTH=30 /DNA_ID= /DNA_START= /DNA_END= /DNA_ORIENTATION=
MKSVSQVNWKAPKSDCNVSTLAASVPPDAM